jgi:lipid-binding SYLF domain-containing protein
MLTAATTLVLTMFLTGCETPDKSGPGSSSPEAQKIERDSIRALDHLFNTSADARWARGAAKAILVFPEITKGGFVVGAQAGKGVLITPEEGLSGYFNTVGASYGLQAGVQQFGYALFFMDHASLVQLRNANGWELGSSPNITVIDKGTARSLSTTTAGSGVYAFFFDQKGLMAGLGLQGSKITRIYP